MRRVLLTGSWCMALALAALAQRQTRSVEGNIPETNPYASPADVEAGRKMYTGRCGHCHGQSGEGGRGATLNSGRLRHGSTARELFLVIRNGIPNSEMPGTFSVPEAEVWRMVAYVQQMGRQGGSDVAPGDAAAGALVYSKSGCAQCHSIGAEGTFLGPDLTGVGARRAIRHLRESIVEPNKDVSLEFRTVVVDLPAGQSIRGIHLNEDEHSIQLRDMKGNLRSFLKTEIKEIRLPRESLMPAYTALSKIDLDNLVAYLSSMRM